MFNLTVLTPRIVASLVIAAATGGSLQAQARSAPAPLAPAVPVSRQFETRAQLELQARAAESQRRMSEAWLLRSRLERGDFQEGDRIIIVLEGTAIVMDTLQVRTGKLLQFPQMGEMSLNGVLRSELTERIRNQLAKFLTTPVVRATPLLPIAVLGSVIHPGYHYAQADIVLRDLVMTAGGPAAQADLNKIVIRRGGDVIWKAADVRVALSDGLSLDALHLRAGDEVYVPEKRRFQITNVTAIISTTMALTLAIVQITSR